MPNTHRQRRNADGFGTITSGGGTLCPVTRKHGYLTRAAAKKAGKRVKQHGYGKVRVYKCRDCPSWHLTSQL